MIYAYYKDILISIDEYVEGMSITCAYGCPLTAKRGEKNRHHFSHISNTCKNNKGEWHTKFQDRVSKQYQEIRIYSESLCKYHIADVCINNTVIEFQHSNMDEKTIRKREAFYTSMGYKLVWVFHVPLWNYKIMTTGKMRRISGSTFPLKANYKNCTVILDMDKKQLVKITGIKGSIISYVPITMKEFDSIYLYDNTEENRDMRPFHHNL